MSRVIRQPEEKMNNCENCGKEFKKRIEHQIYCSPRCRQKAGLDRFKKTDKYKENSINTSNYRIFERDNFQCVYCGASAHEGIKLHVDHIYPLNKGGEDDIINLTTSCEKCNVSKQDRLLDNTKILELWERNKEKDLKSGLVESYKELKETFERVNKKRYNTEGDS